ncbi:MAG: ribonuclease P protein subunit [Thermoplasmata archaeon]|nr:ribonuclease P protein subunit [Thermoplasmata archaeon]NIS13797.1 ribonuclease P protein subunit [Thermoplasmata archaeon]NIS21645.1 ribonuclease P protein subunit [Thermoplasmata archaeon]NIT79229.1 ribonuclease P protein subunit [Thermoplasmata archaeon]NIU50675.1 ribonuclease P protein subunit [Thermoplasmata archaeon]
MRNENNLHMHELVGLRLRVVRASDGGMVGMEGMVVDETRETLVIDADGRRTVPKRGNAFEFTLDDGTTAVLEGDDIAYRPEDRVKRAAGRRRSRLPK